MFVIQGDPPSVTKIILSTAPNFIASICLYTMSYSFAAELTFPQKPATVNAFINFVGQIGTLSLSFATMFITGVSNSD